MWNTLTYLHLDILDFAPSRSGKSMRRARTSLYICRMLGQLIIWFRQCVQYEFLLGVFKSFDASTFFL